MGLMQSISNMPLSHPKCDLGLTMESITKASSSDVSTLDKCNSDGTCLHLGTVFTTKYCQHFKGKWAQTNSAVKQCFSTNHKHHAFFLLSYFFVKVRWWPICQHWQSNLPGFDWVGRLFMCPTNIAVACVCLCVWYSPVYICLWLMGFLLPLCGGYFYSDAGRIPTLIGNSLSTWAISGPPPQPYANRDN